ncbi:MAG: TIGR01212 family radical SAM protein [Muribaculaceae bacterium]|nr:TIGR01212 family radical SAM protein [Muribaculaceae bacterium]
MKEFLKSDASFLTERFPGIGKIQKLGVSLGTSCPNRDGTIGRGGCAYCNNASFSPDYQLRTSDIADMLERGKEFFQRKYPSMKYLAYFQSYTNTHGLPIDRLMDVYKEALNVADVVGLIIGTRPDCVPDELLDRLAELNTKTPVMLEFGAESSHNATLGNVNRCHTWECTVDAVMRATSRGLSVGLHFIMGLPGETEDMMLQTVRRAVSLPVDTLKFHQLQIIRNTALEKRFLAGDPDIHLFTVDEYLDLVLKIIEIVPDHIAIERFVSQSPPGLLVAPRWDLKNYQFTNMLNNRLRTVADNGNNS